MLKEQSIIDQKKIVVIGGHDNFRKNLEKEFDNIKTIAPEARHSNLNFIKDYDLVVFITSYCNHNMWQKVMKNARKSTLLILNRQHNIKILKERMQEKLHRAS